MPLVGFLHLLDHVPGSSFGRLRFNRPDKFHNACRGVRKLPGFGSGFGFQATVVASSKWRVRFIVMPEAYRGNVR